MITVFYNGKCGLCRTEIEHYRRIAPDNRFAWVDLTVEPKLLDELGVSLEDALKVLHVQNDEGVLLTGIDGFLVIWQTIQRFKWLAWVLKIKLFYKLGHILYGRFAAWHFAHMGYEKCVLKG